MGRINLIKTRVWVSWNKYARIDEEDYERVKVFHWQYNSHPGVVFAKVSLEGGGRCLLNLGRFIMNAPEGKILYRKKWDPLNCRKSNFSFDPQPYDVPGDWDKWLEEEDEFDEYGFRTR